MVSLTQFHELSLKCIYLLRFKYKPPDSNLHGMCVCVHTHIPTEPSLPASLSACLIFPVLSYPAASRQTELGPSGSGERTGQEPGSSPPSRFQEELHSSHPTPGCPSPLLWGLGKVSSSFPRPTPPTHSNQGTLKSADRAGERPPACLPLSSQPPPATAACPGLPSHRSFFINLAPSGCPAPTSCPHFPFLLQHPWGRLPLPNIPELPGRGSTLCINHPRGHGEGLQQPQEAHSPVDL